LRIIRGLPVSEARNGFAAYHRLVREYTPSTGVRKLGLLKSILSFEFKTGDFNDRLNQFQWLVSQHDDIDPHDKISDSVKYSLLMASSPTKIREHLQLHADRMKDFESMLETIQSYYASKRSHDYDDMGLGKSASSGKDKDAMEVDALTSKGSKSDGKSGKGKVKGKGKSNDTEMKAQFQGTCNFCKKWGHMEKDCRKKAGTSSGRPSNKGSAPVQGLTQEESPNDNKSKGSGSETAKGVQALIRQDTVQASSSSADWVMALTVGAVSSRVHDGRCSVVVDSGSAITACPQVVRSRQPPSEIRTS
jgi:hypothetical protein